MSILNTNVSDSIILQLQKAIEEGVRLETQKIYDRHMEEFKSEIEAVRSDVIARVTMNLSTWYNFENLGHTLRIEVRKPPEPTTTTGGDAE